MTRARNISNPQAVALPLTVSANITSNATIVVGNVSINTVSYSVGNSTVNTTIHATSISTNGTLSVGNTTVVGTANVSTAINVGANVNLTVANVSVQGADGRYSELLGNIIRTRLATTEGGWNSFVGFANNGGTFLGGILGNGTSQGITDVRLGTSTSPNTVVVSANGSVGVGTTDIYSPVVIKSDWRSGYGQVSLQSNTSGGSRGISLHNSDGTRTAYLSQDASTNDMSIGVSVATGRLFLTTNDANRVTVAANGKVGIANSSPSNTLHVTGTASFSGNTVLNGIRNNLGYVQQLSGSATLGSGIRELFRVSNWQLSSAGFFSIAYTRGSVVHNSMWTWTVNHAGRAHIVQLSSATYTNSTIYIDDDYYGGVIVSVNTGAADQYLDYNVTIYIGTLNADNVNTNWDTVASGYNRASRSTSGSSLQATNIYASGAMSKGSGSFDIVHPLDSTKHLRHSFVEGPRYDLIYRGTVDLVNGTALVNIDSDSVSNGGQVMTSGTFEALTRNPSVYLQNQSSWSRVKGNLSGADLTISCEDSNSNDTISWMVVAERKDTHVLAESNQSDAEGRMILEYDPNRQSVMGDEYVYPTEMVSRAGE